MQILLVGWSIFIQLYLPMKPRCRHTSIGSGGSSGFSIHRRSAHGVTLARILPLMSAIGIGPKCRESLLSVMLSPTTQQWPGGICPTSVSARDKTIARLESYLQHSLIPRRHPRQSRAGRMPQDVVAGEANDALDDLLAGLYNGVEGHDVADDDAAAASVVPRYEDAVVGYFKGGQHACALSWGYCWDGCQYVDYLVYAAGRLQLL